MQLRQWTLAAGMSEREPCLESNQVNPLYQNKL